MKLKDQQLMLYASYGLVIIALIEIVICLGHLQKWQSMTQDVNLKDKTDMVTIIDTYRN